MTDHRLYYALVCLLVLNILTFVYVIHSDMRVHARIDAIEPSCRETP